MTACVNKKSKRVAAVVTASLVGALSIGAPAVALAATNGVEMLVAPEENAFSRGTVTLSGATKKSDGTWVAQAKKDGSALKIEAQEVKPLGADSIKVNDDYKVSFAKADGTAVDSIVEPGQYVVTVECLKGQYAGGKATAKLSVKAATLDEVSAYEVDPSDASNTNDTSFTYTGKKLDVAFADMGGTMLTEGKDYSIKILKKGTDNVASAPSVDVLEAGDYVGYMTGLGQYAGETAEVHFNVAQFNFDNAEVDVDDVIASDSAPKHPTVVFTGTKGSADYAELDPSLVDLTFNSIASGSQLFDKVGAYKFDATVDASNDNILSTKEQTVSVNKVASYATFLYDGAAINDSYVVSEADNEVFDLDKLSATDGKKVVPGLKITAVNGQGNVLHGGQLGLGTWTVTVETDPALNGYQFGGSKTFTVKVVLATVDADANVFVYYDNKAITSLEKTYDGKPINKSDFTVKAFKDDNTEVTDDINFDLYDASGKKVVRIVDAGTYTLKISSDKLELTGTTELTITVNKVDLSKLYVMQTKLWPEHKDGAEYVPTTHDSLDFNKILGYNTGVEAGTTDGATDGKGIDQIGHNIAGTDFSGKVKAQYFNTEKNEWVNVAYPNIFKAEGKYRFTLTGTKDDAVNFQFANDDNTTSVEVVCVDADKLKFNDVQPGSWYFDVVFEASNAGWMNGYAGTKQFGAEDEITRGQVACVLFNIANGDGKVDENKLTFNEDKGYVTGFSDVNGKEFYGKAIAWAKQAGVVNGYGDGTFKPDAPVTREELASMLANFARKVDKVNTNLENADEVLAGVADGSSVSDWAKENVAWAVSSKIMGNGGYVNAAQDITRAEVAAMAVNYRASK